MFIFLSVFIEDKRKGRRKKSYGKQSKENEGEISVSREGVRKWDIIKGRMLLKEKKQVSTTRRHGKLETREGKRKRCTITRRSRGRKGGRKG